MENQIGCDNIVVDLLLLMFMDKKNLQVCEIISQYLKENNLNTTLKGTIAIEFDNPLSNIMK